MSLSRPLVVTAIVFLLPCAAWATTWNVAQTGCNDTSCAPCCTIQAAVEKSSGGDTISIGPGTYPEQVDIRNMFSIGDITFLAAGGPGSVLIAPSAGVVMTHSGFDTNTVTVDGINVSSPDESGFFLAHSGDVVMQDVDANDCGYTAFQIDATGTVTLERCTGNNSDRTGIQVDSAASVQLTDCTANSNTSHGIHVLNVAGLVELVNPTTIGNTDEGVYADITGSLTVGGATVTDNHGQGVRVYTEASVTITGSTITGSFDQGVDIDWTGSDPVDSVTLTGTEINNNGHDGGGENGARLRNVDGPVVVTDCYFDNNGWDGFSPEESVVGDLEIYGGRANGNVDDGYDLRVTGNATVIGARADTNGNAGFATEMPGTIFFQDCIANNNQTGDGFDLQWQDPDPIDGISVIDCTANNNGLLDGGEGIYLRDIEGPVTVTGCSASGNFYSGIRIRNAYGTVLIRDNQTILNLEEGIEIDVDGPVTIVDNISSDNVLDGLNIDSADVGVPTLNIGRNTFQNNGGTGVVLLDLGASGPFKAKCNDIAGNGFGVYLENAVAVDARYVWWGDPTGPSNQGPGAGDAIFAEPGGTILHDPWLVESFTAPVSGCPIFESGFEPGTLAEWDLASP